MTESEPRTITVIEALQYIKRDLEAIPVKVVDMPVIGNAIYNATHGLGAVIQELERVEREAKEAAGHDAMNATQEGDSNADDQN